MTTITVTLFDDEGDEVEAKLPAKWEVCGDCHGKGTTYLGWPARDQPGLTQEDFEEEGDDFREDYLAGNYDRTCPGCVGRTTVLVVDEDACTSEEDAKNLAAWREDQEEERRYESICRAERRFGC